MAERNPLASCLARAGVIKSGTSALRSSSSSYSSSTEARIFEDEDEDEDEDELLRWFHF